MAKHPEGMTGRSVTMSIEMARWFLEHAFHTGVSQQKHYRSALSEYRTRIEREAGKAPGDIERGAS